MKEWLQPEINKTEQNVNEENKVHNIGGVSISDKEIGQTVSDIVKILAGKEQIDTIGSNGPYKFIFNTIASERNVVVNNLDPRMDPTEIEGHMLTDTLVISGLPDDITEKISNSLANRKTVIVGKLYKDELGQIMEEKSEYEEQNQNTTGTTR